MPDSDPPSSSPRRVAIVGSGLSSLGFLKAFLDLPEDARKGWVIDCLEKRNVAGGIWRAQGGPKPRPPETPDTPMYDDFETITLASGMTFPNRPLPPSTPLFCSDHVIANYIQDFIDDECLRAHIKLNHEVLSCTLDSSSDLPWTIRIRRSGANGADVEEVRRYTTLIVGTGVTPIPRIVHLEGQKEWLEAGGGKREIVHSMWYENPKPFEGKTVIVLGAHPSGIHVVNALADVAKDVYHSYIPGPLSNFFSYPDTPRYHHIDSTIARLSKTGMTFENGLEVSTPGETVIVQCTGWNRDFPILGDLVGPVKGLDFSWDDPDFPLENNSRYIRPLYRCLLPCDKRFPPGSLAFTCLFPIIYNLPTSYAQGLWLAHVLANMDQGVWLLPHREEAYKEVRSWEAAHQQPPVGAVGYLITPVGKVTDDYSDALIQEIKEKSRFPLPSYLLDPPSRAYTEPWRRRTFQVTLPLIKPWLMAKKAGVALQFSQGAVTEADYMERAERLIKWWEKETGCKFKGMDEM